MSALIIAITILSMFGNGSAGKMIGGAALLALGAAAMTEWSLLDLVHSPT